MELSDCFIKQGDEGSCVTAVSVERGGGWWGRCVYITTLHQCRSRLSISFLLFQRNNMAGGLVNAEGSTRFYVYIRRGGGGGVGWSLCSIVAIRF